MVHVTHRCLAPLVFSRQAYVTVIDVNDVRPVFSLPGYQTAVYENEPAGTSVLTLTATDLDEGDNGRVDYSLQGPGSGNPRQCSSSVETRASGGPCDSSFFKMLFSFLCRVCVSRLINVRSELSHRSGMAYDREWPTSTTTSDIPSNDVEFFQMTIRWWLHILTYPHPDRIIHQIDLFYTQCSK